MKNIIVIGGGPAGIMASYTAAQMGAKVTLWERNKRLGKKLTITGKGRCNITNFTDNRNLVKNLTGNGVFLHSAFSRFSARDTYNFFESQGLKLKIERGNRVFPSSDNAYDVMYILKQALYASGVRIVYSQRAKDLIFTDKSISYVIDVNNQQYNADAVIIATGGVSYPATGSTGDGYSLAMKAGHTIIPVRPSLVPLETKESWPKAVSGLSLKNVELIIANKEKILAKQFGEMLFTHFGISGPIVLTLSNFINFEETKKCNYKAYIDLKPALNEKKLAERLQRNFEKFSRKHFINSFSDILPNSLIPVFVQLTKIDEHKIVNQLTRTEKLQILKILKSMPLTIKGTRPIDEAIVTAGGVCVKEINPKTMESKLINGLYFAGEVMDINGLTGGYNLQAAWSSGFTAGYNAVIK